ncbi:MAG: GGDEF domain-containing protein, partial [Kangiellaceae bacterium]
MSKLLMNKAGAISFHHVLIVFLFSSCFLISKLNAAQYIDALPTKLSGNWTICQFNSLEQSQKHKVAPTCIKNDSVTLSNIEPSKGSSVAVNLIEGSIRDKILNNPSMMGENYYIYSKQFIVSSKLKKNTLAIYVGAIDETDEIRINGQLIGKTGNFPPFFQGAYRNNRLYVIPNSIINFNQFNYIEITTYNSVNQAGLNRQSVLIGDYLQLEQTQQNKNLFYVSAITILLLLTLHQIFNYFAIRENNETLYLAGFLLIFTLIAFFRSQAPINLGFDLSAAYKIESFLITSGVISFSLFLFQFFNLEIRRSYLFAFVLMGLVSLLNLIWPHPSAIRLVAEVTSWLIIILAFFTGGSAMLIAWVKKKDYSKIVGVITFLSFLIIIFDAIMQSQFVFYSQIPINPFYLIFTSVILGIVISSLITHKYWQFFKGATFDHLFGTLLKPAFFRRLSEELQRSQKDQNLLLVSVIHISQYKTLAADYGSKITNSLLLNISESLSKILKPFDLVCRMNDDEFCIAISCESRIY